MAGYERLRPGGRPLTRLAFVAAVLVVPGGIGGAAWVARARQAEAESRPFSPASPPASIGVGALGRLEPGWKIYQVGPATNADGARVETLLVDEGDEVQAGQVLAVLDTAARRAAALKEATAQVLVSRAKLGQVKAGTKPEDVAAQEALVEQLKASLARADAEFNRARSLISSRAMAAEEYDQRRFQRDVSRATLRQAEATLAALKAVRPEDVAAAEADLAKSEAGVSRAEADCEAVKVRSPIAGRVLKVYARPGEKVGESGVLDLGDTSAMQAVAEVYERDATRVKPGQRAVVRVQSLPGELTGEVVRVGWKVGRQVVFDNDPVKDTDARVVEVRIRLDPAAGARVAGLSYARVEVRIDAGGG